MKPRLSLSVGSTWLAASLTRTRGWLRSSSEVLQLPHQDFDASIGGLSGALAGIAAELQAADVALRGAGLQVELGMAHARIGLMHLREGEGARLGPKALESYVSGWMQQAMHLQPAEHIVRWQVLRDPHFVLASFVDKQAYAALLAFAEEHRLKFLSCIPAILGPVRQARAGATETLVWTEGAGTLRDPCVQMLRFERGQLQASWRGWLPPASTAAGAQAELESALQRFQAYAGGPAGAEVARTHWPATPLPA